MGLGISRQSPEKISGRGNQVDGRKGQIDIKSLKAELKEDILKSLKEELKEDMLRSLGVSLKAELKADILESLKKNDLSFIYAKLRRLEDDISTS